MAHIGVSILHGTPPHQGCWRCLRWYSPYPVSYSHGTTEGDPRDVLGTDPAPPGGAEKTSDVEGRASEKP